MCGGAHGSIGASVDPALQELRHEATATLLEVMQGDGDFWRGVVCRTGSYRVHAGSGRSKTDSGKMPGLQTTVAGTVDCSRICQIGPSFLSGNM